MGTHTYYTVFSLLFSLSSLGSVAPSCMLGPFPAMLLAGPSAGEVNASSLKRPENSIHSQLLQLCPENSP